jgi:hypothetical protein
MSSKSVTLKLGLLTMLMQLVLCVSLPAGAPESTAPSNTAIGNNSQEAVNAPKQLRKVFVSVRQTNVDKYDWDVQACIKLFRGIGRWSGYQVVLDTASFKDFLERAKPTGQQAAYFNTCLERKTLNPSIPGPNMGNSLLFELTDRFYYDITLAESAEGATRVAIVLDWQDAGQYRTTGGSFGIGPAFQVRVPHCAVEVSSPGRETRTLRFSPTLKSSYDGKGSPRQDACEQVGNFVAERVFGSDTK